MRLNLMQHTEALTDHRNLLQNAVREKLADYSILVECEDTPGVFDVYTPSDNGEAFYNVTPDGVVIAVEDIIGGPQQ